MSLLLTPYASEITLHVPALLFDPPEELQFEHIQAVPSETNGIPIVEMGLSNIKPKDPKFSHQYRAEMPAHELDYLDQLAQRMSSNKELDQPLFVNLIFHNAEVKHQTTLAQFLGQ